MPRRNLVQLYKEEFTGYNMDKFRQDLLAGLTVAAVALAAGAGFRRGFRRHCFRRNGHGHHCRFDYRRVVRRSIPDLRTNRRHERRFDCAGPEIRPDRRMDCRWFGRRDAAYHRFAASGTLYRLHSCAGHHRIHVRHCPDHRHRPDRQSAGDKNRRQRIFRNKVDQLLQRRVYPGLAHDNFECCRHRD